MVLESESYHTIFILKKYFYRICTFELKVAIVYYTIQTHYTTTNSLVIDKMVSCYEPYQELTLGDKIKIRFFFQFLGILFVKLFVIFLFS